MRPAMHIAKVHCTASQRRRHPPLEKKTATFTRLFLVKFRHFLFRARAHNKKDRIGHLSQQQCGRGSKKICEKRHVDQ
jgi:hypothetical protein